MKEVEPWEIWVEDHYPDVQKKGADLTTLVMVFAQGNPGIMSSTLPRPFPRCEFHEWTRSRTYCNGLRKQKAIRAPNQP